MTLPTSTLRGKVVQCGRIAVDEESVEGLLIEIDPAALREIRGELGDTIEDIGSAMGLLREAINDTTAGALQSGNGAPEAGDVLRGLGFGAEGNTFEGHSALRLMPMPAEEGAESLADFMLMRRDRCMAVIWDRVRAAREAGAGFSLGDLTLMLHEAWTGGGAAMADGITARESMRSLELMDAMEAETDRQRGRHPVTLQPRALPWPGESGLMSLLDRKGDR